MLNQYLITDTFFKYNLYILCYLFRIMPTVKPTQSYSYCYVYIYIAIVYLSSLFNHYNNHLLTVNYYIFMKSYKYDKQCTVHSN